MSGARAPSFESAANIWSLRLLSSFMPRPWRNTSRGRGAPAVPRGSTSVSIKPAWTKRLWITKCSTRAPCRSSRGRERATAAPPSSAAVSSKAASARARNLLAERRDSAHEHAGAEVSGGIHVRRIAIEQHRGHLEPRADHRSGEIVEVELREIAGSGPVGKIGKQLPHARLEDLVVGDHADEAGVAPQHLEQLPLLHDELEVRAVSALHPLLYGAPGHLALGADDVACLVRQLCDQCAEHVVLVGEVVVERAAGEIGLAHDVARGGCPQPLLGEDLARGGKQFRAVLCLQLLAAPVALTSCYARRHCVLLHAPFPKVKPKRTHLGASALLKGTSSADDTRAGCSGAICERSRLRSASICCCGLRGRSWPPRSASAWRARSPRARRPGGASTTRPRRPGRYSTSRSRCAS